MVCKESLMHLCPETEMVANTANGIESNKFVRSVPSSGYDLRPNRGGYSGNIYFPFGGLIHGEQVEATDLSTFWMVAQFPLVLCGIESYWHSDLCGKHLPIDLNILGDGLPYVSYRQSEYQDCLLSSRIVHPVQPDWFRLNRKPRTLRNFGKPLRFLKLPIKDESRPESSYCNRDGQGNQYPVSSLRPLTWSILPATEPISDEDDELGWCWWGIFLGGVGLVEIGGLFIWRIGHMIDDGLPVGVGVCLICFGLVLVGLGAAALRHAFMEANPSSENSVTQKHLTRLDYCNTVIGMANVLSTDKQIAVIGALAEGSSIRSIERITGVHRDTIMRLGVKVGQGCTTLLDAKMRDLPCNRLEFDEIWGFIGKKEKHVTVDDDSECGDAWTFCAVDSETKLVPAFKVGKRDAATANAFVQDVASRMRNRVQISTDGLRAYVEAVEKAFGSEVDYAQIVKTYGYEEVSNNRRYSAPEFVSSEKKVIVGQPNVSLISTSYIERLNATTRLHMRRLTRLTLAFSKKRENFEAAVGLHFAYYNFVKRHNSLRCTPAMAAGVERDFWSVADLLEAAA